MTFAELLYVLSVENPVMFWVLAISFCSLGPAVLFRGFERLAMLRGKR